MGAQATGTAARDFKGVGQSRGLAADFRLLAFGYEAVDSAIVIAIEGANHFLVAVAVDIQAGFGDRIGFIGLRVEDRLWAVAATVAVDVQEVIVAARSDHVDGEADIGETLRVDVDIAFVDRTSAAVRSASQARFTVITLAVSAIFFLAGSTIRGAGIAGLGIFASAVAARVRALSAVFGASRTSFSVIAFTVAARIAGIRRNLRHS